MDTEIQALNNLCKMLYESVDGTSRLQAEQNLAELAASPDCLRRCMVLLENGTAPYAQVVASNTLLKVVCSKTGVNLQQRLELSKYLLHYLGKRSAALPPYVITSLCQLFSRITKLSWHDYDMEAKNFPFRETVNTIISLAEEDQNQGPLAIQILNALVSDINTIYGFDSLTKQRKTSSSFRDGFLFDIFKLSTSMLEKALAVGVNTQLVVVGYLLNLSLSCLTFDFVGTLSDETSDDNATVQVPTLWRLAFTDGEVISMFFRLYDELPMELATRTLQNIVQLTSLRRTIFSSTERHAYLAHLVRGVKGIMERPTKLRQQESFHEFCRVVSRLKSSYQLVELMKVDEYPAMIALLAEFTEQSLRAFEFSANSTYYLLSFWQRMVSSMPYVKAADPHLLNLYCPKIITAYIESRMQYARAVVRAEIGDDPLDDQGAIQQVMEQVAIICRCEYEKSAELITQLFDREYAIYERLTSNSPSIEGREAIACLTWLVTIIGAAIQGRAAFNGSEPHDIVDGDFTCRVLNLMELSDSRLASGASGNSKMETAFIYFLDQFRKIHVSDQILKMSKVYERLEKNLGLQDETEMLTVYVRKIINNLKYHATEGKLIEETLSLLSELSMGYVASRRLVQLPDIQLLLRNHTSEHFSFLSSEADFKTMRSRTIFYGSLMRLLCLDLNDIDNLFYTFMQPFTDPVREICDVFQMNAPVVDQERLQHAVVGLCRDLRGIAMACHVKFVYSILFDWMYPNVFTILARSVEVWADCGDVVNPVMKLLSELCQNRQQRLQYEMASCSAVLLFREVSKIICAYGARMLSLPAVAPERAYKERYKNIGTVFTVLKMALSGGYVPFGVFRLYGDTCLQNALEMFVKLFMYIPESEFHSYTKIAQSFHSLLECIALDNMCFLTNLQVEVFAKFLRYTQQGTVSLDSIVVTASCATLDLILNYLYRRLTRTAPPHTHVGAEAEGDNCIRALEAQPNMLCEMLSTILTILIFDDVKCQWSLSRPLLGLILLQEDYFQRWKLEFIAQQPEEKRASFVEAFTTLMDGVQRNVGSKNKDVFTLNLNIFRRTIADSIKGENAVSPPSASLSDMMA